ncbi:FAD-binding protein [Paenibacillus roseipurpureus]|uniref:FAD-binding protein n=1 Tax=Paenibacillus roseopurpureus TaxID=2918901 RepID=A0AA96LNM3_9BACL|nr:FAD-binding protein [Paenibacillus sp. MBLB1832]WNR44431.1 FAD-binding protein [Paenibacillus sp. MBLB1832]
MPNDRNWAGNYRYSTSDIHIPTSLEHLQELVASRSQLKVLGTRHSFNGIADSQESLLSLAKLNRVIALDRVNHRVTVEGGIRYGELGQYLHAQGYALHNLASLPHITVAGAIATATHGSGDRNGNLATAVHAIEIVKADGNISAFSRDQPEADVAGAAVHLGGLGVVTKITLDVVPTFHMRQHVYDHLPLAQLEAHFDEIFASAYSVSLFTDWNAAAFNQVWLKQKIADPTSELPPVEPVFFRARLADQHRHPVPGHTAENCSEQMGVSGPWHERMPHFRMDFTPSAGEELQSEYFVPRQHAYQALCALNGMREAIAPHLYISEIRTVAADDLWMSPSYQQDVVAFHFTWKPDWEAVRQLLPVIEQRLEPFQVRPHWGKLFTMSSAQIYPRFEKIHDFQRLLRQYDPNGKFMNDFLRTTVMNK